MRPVPDAARRGRRRLELVDEHGVANRETPRDLAYAFVPVEEVAHAELHVVARQVERAAAGSGKVDQSGEPRPTLHRRQRQRLDGHAPRIRVEGVGAVPADVRRAGDGGPALEDGQPVEPYPGAFEAQRGLALGERLAVSRALGDGEPSEAVRLRVLAVEMKVARDQAIDVVVLEIEGFEKILHGARCHANPGIDFLAAIATRIAEGELAAHVHARRAVADHRAADVGIVVLDDEVAVHFAPGDAPRTDFAADEPAFDARTPEGPQHHTVEPAHPVDGNRHGAGAEHRHQPGQQAVALLPVRARDAERQLGALAPRRGPFERHIGVDGRELARFEANGFAVEPVDEPTADPHRAERRVVAERAQFQRPTRGGLGRAGRQSRAEDIDARRRRHRHLAVPLALRELAGRELQAIVARRAAAHPQPARFEEGGQGQQIDVPVVDYEARA